MKCFFVLSYLNGISLHMISSLTFDKILRSVYFLSFLFSFFISHSLHGNANWKLGPGSGSCNHSVLSFFPTSSRLPCSGTSSERDKLIFKFKYHSYRARQPVTPDAEDRRRTRVDAKGLPAPVPLLLVHATRVRKIFKKSGGSKLR